MKELIKNPSCSDQRGVTLLLAILVLSAVMAVSVSLATIMFVEVRSSSELLRSETSYYGGNAVVEQGIYKIKRQVSSNISAYCTDPDLPNCYSRSVGNLNLEDSPPQEKKFTDPNLQRIVPDNAAPPDVKSFSAFAQRFPLFNPDNPYNPKIPGSGGSGYTSVKITYLSPDNTDPLKVYICEFDPSFSIGPGANQYLSEPCSDRSSNQYWTVAKESVLSSLGPTNRTWLLNKNRQQEIVLYNENSNGPIYVLLQFADSLGNPAGIPYFQQTAVDINAQNGDVGRKIRVEVPNR